jgi:predicted kinase
MSELIIIIGPPASGKTTLSNKLERDLQLPVIGTDTLKEKICISLGIKDDLQWTDKLNLACYDLLFYYAQKLLEFGNSLIIESDFRHSDSELVSTIAHEAEITQVLLEVDHEVILERFKRRWESGERHPAQADNLWFDELAKGPTTGLQFLDVPGRKIKVDATSKESLDYDKLLADLTVKA